MHNTPHYGILGGTFDPPHIGHLALAQEAFARLGLDRVWFVPTGDPPHKPGRPISPAADRVAMARLATEADARFGVSEVELTLAGLSYTVRTLGMLRALWGADVEMTLILGWDMLLYLPQWHEPAKVVAAVEQVAAAHRPGFSADQTEQERVTSRVAGLAEKLVILPGPLLGVSASEVRARVASGLPIRYLVVDSVRSYIHEHDLYSPPRLRDV
jgi:nicotinate-nucleotide adenylyltransferase